MNSWCLMQIFAQWPDRRRNFLGTKSVDSATSIVNLVLVFAFAWTFCTAQRSVVNTCIICELNVKHRSSLSWYLRSRMIVRFEFAEFIDCLAQIIFITKSLTQCKRFFSSWLFCFGAIFAINIALCDDHRDATDISIVVFERLETARKIWICLYIICVALCEVQHSSFAMKLQPKVLVVQSNAVGFTLNKFMRFGARLFDRTIAQLYDSYWKHWTYFIV